MNDLRSVVYGLSLDGATIRYVGLTTGDLRQRWYRHVHSVRKGSPAAVHCWIRECGPQNVRVTVLDARDTLEELQEAEQRWIRTLREDGAALLNATDGGECFVRPGRPRTAESRQKQSESHKAQRAREVAEGLPHPALGYRWSEEQRDKLRGRSVSEASRQRMAESAKRRGANNKGRPMSEEQKAKLRAAQLGRKATDETRAKQSEAHYGRAKSPEHRAAIAASVRATLARRRGERERPEGGAA